MAGRGERERGRAAMQAIREVLYEHWDPIGLKGMLPGDEYDDYIGGVYRLLVARPSEDEVMAHLRRIDPCGDEYLRGRAHLRRVAQLLLAIERSGGEQT